MKSVRRSASSDALTPTCPPCHRTGRRQLQAASECTLTGCCTTRRRGVWGAWGQWMIWSIPGTCWPWTLVDGGAASMDGGSQAGKWGRHAHHGKLRVHPVNWGPPNVCTFSACIIPTTHTTSHMHAFNGRSDLQRKCQMRCTPRGGQAQRHDQRHFCYYHVNVQQAARIPNTTVRTEIRHKPG